MSTMHLENYKRYNSMENVLQKANKHTISLPLAEIKRNNKLLKELIEKNLVEALKQTNPLFEKLFKKIVYGGSYYEGLKVGKPEEYDLDLVFSLPKQYNAKVVQSDIAGYSFLLLEHFKMFRNSLPNGEDICERTLEKCMSENYLLCSKVRSWMEGALQKVLNKISQSSAGHAISISLDDNKVCIDVKLIKSGPALTLKIRGQHEGNPIVIDVDLVISFCFNSDNWPKNCKPNPYITEQPHFYLVPKEPISRDGDKYWRLSFPDQERLKISGCERMKPTIRLLKKLRDQLNHTVIASYYIKTIFLWEMDNNIQEWNNSLSYCFMKGLTLYEQHLRRQNIPFYWDEKMNLLGNVNEKTLLGIANNIKNIIDDINRKISEPFVVLTYLCPDLMEKQEFVENSSVLLRSSGACDFSDSNSTLAGSDCSFSNSTEHAGNINDSESFLENTENLKMQVPAKHSVDIICRMLLNIQLRLDSLENKIDQLTNKIEAISNVTANGN